MIDRERQIAEGTVLLTAAELAPRIGFGTGRRGAEKVRARARIGALPCYHPTSRTYLFHWPTVVESINRKAKR